MRYGSVKMNQMPPVHAANLAANSGNTVYGVDVIGPFGISFSGILVKIQIHSFMKMLTKCCDAMASQGTIDLTALGTRAA